MAVSGVVTLGAGFAVDPAGAPELTLRSCPSVWAIAGIAPAPASIAALMVKIQITFKEHRNNRGFIRPLAFCMFQGIRSTRCCNGEADAEHFSRAVSA